LIASLIAGWLNFLDGQKHPAPAVAAVAVWAAAAIIGFAVCALVYARAKDGALRASAVAGAWLGRGVSAIFCLVDRCLVAPSPAPVPGAGIFTSPFLLSLLIWIPVIVATAIAFMPNPRGRYEVLIKQIAFFANLGMMAVLFIAYNQFENFLPTMQYEEKIPWLPGIGVTYHLGVDGPGLLMLMLSGLIGIAS